MAQGQKVSPKAGSNSDSLFDWSFENKKLVQEINIARHYLQIPKREQIKVAGLGLATFKDKIIGTECGTLLYMAPEAMGHKLHSAKVDIYSFGLMMQEIRFGKRVLTGRRREDIYGRIKDEHYRPQIEAIRSDLSLRQTASECKDIIKTIKQKHIKQGKD